MLTRVLRWSTLLVFPVVYLILMAAAEHDDGRPTAVLRAVLAICVAASLAVLVWIARVVPRGTLTSMLRQREMLALRIILHGIAIAIGTITAAVGPVFPLAPLASALMILSILVVIAGYLGGG